jgi:glycopeptide antibiotics resistance protein
VESSVLTQLLNRVGAYRDLVFWLGLLAMVIILVLAVVMTRSGKSMNGRAVCRVGLMFSVALLLAVTLMPTAVAGFGYSLSLVNLVPGRGIYLQLTNVSTVVGAYNIMGNIGLFLLPGVLAPVALGWSGKRTVLTGFVLSLAIELAQFAFQLGRASDVDDVLLNTVGAALGVAILAVLRRLAPSKLRPAREDVSEPVS